MLFTRQDLSALSLTVTIGLTMSPLATRLAHAQLTPTAPPTSVAPKAAAPAPLPPPISISEQRFRELSTYIKGRGVVDESTRRDLATLALALDVDISAPTSTLEMVPRLCPARAQVAIWLGDDAAMDAAFTRMQSVMPASDAVALAWTRELITSGQFDRASTLLQSRTFAPERLIDVKIAYALALLGLHRFNEAQAAFNEAPAAGRSTAQQSLISNGSIRLNTLKTMWLRELSAIAQDQSRGDIPLVELVTSKGSVLIELFEDHAPNTVGNFIEHVEAGTYAGTKFHRRLRGFGVQGGDPATAAGDAGGRSTGGWTVPDELDRVDRRAPLVGRLVMVKQPAAEAPDSPRLNSAGCQFMFLLTPSEQLDGQYTVFGQVRDGWEVARALGNDDEILSARVVEKRAHDYKGVRLTEEKQGDFSMPRLPGAAAARASETRFDPATAPKLVTPTLGANGKQEISVPITPPASAPKKP